MAETPASPTPGPAAGPPGAPAAGSDAGPAAPSSAFDPASLRWDDRGLAPAIAQDAATQEVLMVAWMNRAALEETLATGRVCYWSRSRQAFWRKGETSGHVQRLVDLRVDCDRDVILMQVEQSGPACHTRRRTCFYTAVRDGREVELMAPDRA